jgi:DNA-binding NarL/FixJ family response regulator
MSWQREWMLNLAPEVEQRWAEANRLKLENQALRESVAALNKHIIRMNDKARLEAPHGSTCAAPGEFAQSSKCGLSDQELEIFTLISEGAYIRQICKQLMIANDAVLDIIERATKALGVSTRTKAVRLLIERGAIPCPYCQGEGE